MENTNEILTVNAAAEMLSCDVKTLEDKARTGELPGVKIGRSWIFPRSALVNAINEMAKEEAANRRARKHPQPLAIAVSPAHKRKSKSPPALPPLPVLPN